MACSGQSIKKEASRTRNTKRQITKKRSAAAKKKRKSRWIFQNCRLKILEALWSMQKRLPALEGAILFCLASCTMFSAIGLFQKAKWKEKKVKKKRVSKLLKKR